jgi:hypothetical protein
MENGGTKAEFFIVLISTFSVRGPGKGEPAALRLRRKSTSTNRTWLKRYPLIFVVIKILTSQNRTAATNPHTTKIGLLLSTIAGSTTDPKEIWALSANIAEILSSAASFSFRFSGAKSNKI